MDKHDEVLVPVHTQNEIGGRKVKDVFIPHQLRTLEIDTEKKVFRINGEDFGKGCTGFQIICHNYNSFDIRVEIDTTVKYVAIKNGKLIEEQQYKTDDPWFGKSDEQPNQIEKTT